MAKKVIYLMVMLLVINPCILYSCNPCEDLYRQMNAANSNCNAYKRLIDYYNGQLADARVKLATKIEQIKKIDTMINNAKASKSEAELERDIIYDSLMVKLPALGIEIALLYVKGPAKLLELVVAQIGTVTGAAECCDLLEDLIDLNATIEQIEYFLGVAENSKATLQEAIAGLEDAIERLSNYLAYLEERYDYWYEKYHVASVAYCECMQYDDCE